MRRGRTLCVVGVLLLITIAVCALKVYSYIRKNGEDIERGHDGLVSIKDIAFWEGTVAIPYRIGDMQFKALLDTAWTTVAFVGVDGSDEDNISKLFFSGEGAERVIRKCTNHIGTVCKKTYDGDFQGADGAQKQKWDYYVTSQSPSIGGLTLKNKDNFEYRLVKPDSVGLDTVKYTLDKTLSLSDKPIAVIGTQALHDTLIIINFDEHSLFLGNVPTDPASWLQGKGFTVVHGVYPKGATGIIIPMTVGGIEGLYQVDTGDATPGLGVPNRKGMSITPTGQFSLTKGATGSCMCQEQALAAVEIGGVSFSQVPLLLGDDSQKGASGGLFGPTIMEYIFTKVAFVCTPGKTIFAFKARDSLTSRPLDFIHKYAWNPDRPITACGMTFPAGKKAQPALNKYCTTR